MSLAHALRTAHRERQARMWAAAAPISIRQAKANDARLKGVVVYSSPVGPVIPDHILVRDNPVMAAVVTLKDLAPIHKINIKLADIIDASCAITGVSRSEFMSHRRNKRLNQARFAVYYIAKSRTQYSYPQIGSACGGRDHTTIMNGVKRAVENRHNLSSVIAAVENLLFCGQEGN